MFVFFCAGFPGTAFPMIIFFKFTSICPTVYEGQRMFAEGPIFHFVLFVTVVDQHAHDEHRYRFSSGSYIPPPSCV